MKISVLYGSPQKNYASCWPSEWFSNAPTFLEEVQLFANCIILLMSVLIYFFVPFQFIFAHTHSLCGELSSLVLLSLARIHLSCYCFFFLWLLTDSSEEIPGVLSRQEQILGPVGNYVILVYGMLQ